MKAEKKRRAEKLLPGFISAALFFAAAFAAAYPASAATGRISGVETNAVRISGDTYIFSEDEGAVFETSESGIRFYDENGDIIAGGAHVSRVSFTVEKTISKIELYYKSSSESPASWHSVFSGKISVAFDETAPAVSISLSGKGTGGFYNSSFSVTVSADDSKNSSGGSAVSGGIAKIEYYLKTDEAASEKYTIYEFEGDASDSSLKTSLSKTVNIARDGLCGNVTVYVCVTDRAGYETCVCSQTVKADTQPPGVSVSFDNNDASSGKYFSSGRTALITVTESNFSADGVSINITNSKGSVPSEGSWKMSAQGVWTCEVVFEDEGNYTFSVSCTDKAGNTSQSTDYGTSACPESFTIDKTPPQVSVSFDNNSALNGKYFKSSRTAKITVTEENFSESLAEIRITHTVEGAEADCPQISWSKSGNTHTAVIVFEEDGDYTFSVSVRDMAQNSAGEINSEGCSAYPAFTIDTTVDDEIITGVTQGGSYTDEVAAVIDIYDENYESCTAVLVRTSGSYENEDVTREFGLSLADGTDTGVYAVIDSFEKISENDGIYTLCVSYTDLAGNEAEESVTFTVNRFGSVYVYGDYLKTLIEGGGAYVQSIDEDIVITEYNPAGLEAGSADINITRDSAALSQVHYTVEASENDDASSWCVYTYVIPAENFTEDGIYKIAVSSDDVSGNSSESTQSGYDDIVFCVDSSAPEIVLVTGLEKAVIRAKEQEVTVTVYDTYGLGEITVYVDSGAVLEITDFTQDANNYCARFTLEEKRGTRYIRIVVSDKAGNTADTAADGFALSAAFEFNCEVKICRVFFARPAGKKVYFFGSMAAVLSAAAGGCIFVHKKRKKTKKC